MHLVPTDPPPPWPLADMLRALPFALEARAVGVLRWRIQQDDRPLRIEAAILAVQGESAWDLANLYRHPAYENEWRLSQVHDAPHVPFRGYGHPPTEAEIETFLSDSWWTRNDGDRFSTLASGGQPPWWWTPARN